MVVPRTGQKSDGRWADHNAERRGVIMAALIALIEESEPGADIPLQAIADRAGIKRSVIYRHFADRQDLDSRTREYAIALHIDSVMPTLEPDDSVRGTVSRTVSTYVNLVAARPRLHEWVEHGPGSHDASGRAVVTGTKEAVVQRISSLFIPAAALLGQDDPGLDVAIFAVVAMVDGAVTRWLRTREQTWDTAELSRLITESLMIVLQGHARARGLEIDVDLPIAELLAQATQP
ncbi:TetR/AcrR family transcriptional regulator [Nocardia brasiliensis]|uniref:TetR/AcrR family transcriptional regulator n=1 Tax=Nocardia brasiliensis TaxID=37326 RepID=UPI003D8F3336